MGKPNEGNQETNKNDSRKHQNKQMGQALSEINLIYQKEESITTKTSNWKTPNSQN